MRDVAIVGTAQSVHARRVDDRNEVEMLMPVLQELKDGLGVTQADLDFTCSGSTDYLAGQGFSFVGTLDGVGPYPPISESHVEADGAWALYEAWVKIQTGAADTALVYSYGKSSPGDLPRVLSRQLDPYYHLQCRIHQECLDAQLTKAHAEIIKRACIISIQVICVHDFAHARGHEFTVQKAALLALSEFLIGGRDAFVPIDFGRKQKRQYCRHIF